VYSRELHGRQTVEELARGHLAVLGELAGKR
jgi:hypothetical protein